MDKVFNCGSSSDETSTGYIKNTNLKIVHRIVMQEDRELIGQSMNMTQEQIEYISSLRRGFVAVYAEGDMRPKLVQMPYIKEDFDYPRKTVIQNVKDTVKKNFITMIENMILGLLVLLYG